MNKNVRIIFWDFRKDYFNGCGYDVYVEEKISTTYRQLIYLEDNYLYKKEIYNGMFSKIIDHPLYIKLFK